MLISVEACGGYCIEGMVGVLKEERTFQQLRDCKGEMMKFIWRAGKGVESTEKRRMVG